MKKILAAALATLITLGGSVAVDDAPAAAKGLNARRQNRPTTIRARRPTVVIFAPASWAADAKTSQETAEMVAHVSFAVEDVKRCKGAAVLDVRMVFADRLLVEIDGRHDGIDLARKFPDTAGAYLLKPGKKTCAIATPKDTAFLGDLLSHAVGTFFAVPACLKKGMSDPCEGGGTAMLSSRESRADPPICFPERTVLWAATFFDEHGNAFGGIRAGHLVRIREDFVGPNGDQALIEVDEPVRVQAMVPRRVLVAFTRQELEPKVGFSRWVAGAPVTVEKLEDGFPRLFLADPHHQPKESASIISQCSSVSGSVTLRYRDECHGAWPTTNATTHGERRVFWKAPTRLKSLHGPDGVTIPADEWVFLVDRGKEHSVIEYRSWLRHTLYLGRAPTRGMHYVPSGIGRGSDHPCCEGLLTFRPEVNVSEGREAVILSSTPISTPDGKSVATLKKGLRVRVLREQDFMAFVAYRWPTWDAKNFTFQLHGWIDKKFLGGVENGRLPTDAGPRDVLERGVEPDGRPETAARR